MSLIIFFLGGRGKCCDVIIFFVGGGVRGYKYIEDEVDVFDFFFGGGGGGDLGERVEFFFLWVGGIWYGNF